jgi:MFS family permease
MNRSIVSMLVATFVLRISTAITGGMLVFFVNDLTKGSGGGQGPIAILHGGFYATELTGAIFFGILADRYGRKVIMVLGPLFGSVAVLMTAMTTMMPVLFVTRLLEGSSTAASIPSTLGFIAAETADDEVLRGRVVSTFELVSLGGMLAIGPALSGVLWDAFGRPAFFLNCGFYLVALVLYAYGVSEAPPAKRAVISTREEGRAGGELSRYWRMATSRTVLLFAPTWLAINAILGLWAAHAPLLLTGNKHDSGQFLMQGASPTAIGLGEAVFAVFFGLGLVFWGAVYARFRRTTMLLWGLAAFVVMAVDILAINHLGGVSVVLLCVLVGIGLVALFVLSGATPAALGLLADVSEGFHEDRSAIMGLYSVFLGLGQVLGALIGGLAAWWNGIDGLVVATGGLLVIGLAALLNLRSQEAAGQVGRPLKATSEATSVVPADLARSARATLESAAGVGPRPAQAPRADPPAKEER